MNAIQILMDRFWIRKEKDKDLYYQVRRELKETEKYFGEYPGWRLMANERVIKLEKTPSYAREYMGITEFKEVEDYCILCALLMYLEDKEDSEAFLLSEFTEYAQAQINPYMKIDWTLFGHRKALIRVMIYSEKMGFVISHEGDVDDVAEGLDREVLYENTGLSRYFAVNFFTDVSDKRSHTDFENETENTVADTDRGHYRINRVYRRLLSEPAMYWDGSAEEVDSYYLKNQRNAITTHLTEAFGGRLDIHRNTAMFLFEDDDEMIGEVFPKGSTISDVVLLICAGIRKRNYVHREDDTVVITEDEFRQLVRECRRRYSPAWSKEYREMEETRLYKTVLAAMQEWQFLEASGDEVVIYPAAYKLAGVYPKDFDPRAIKKKEAEDKRSGDGKNKDSRSQNGERKRKVGNKNKQNNDNRISIENIKLDNKSDDSNINVQMTLF